MSSANQLGVVSQLLRAMADSDSPDRLCELLGTDVLVGFNVAATYLAILAPDGRITMVGSWGYPEERRSPADRPSIWYPMAITDTIRTGEIQVYETWDAYRERYPHLINRAGPGESFVCVPFSANGVRSGGLGLTFNTPLTDYADSRQLWEVLAQAGDLFVNKSWAGQVFKGTNSPAVNMDDPAAADELRKSFSKRDLDVIRMTIDGLTVTAISRVLNYSESTIKQTRIAAYKKLGVRRSEDLAHAAEHLNLFG